MNYIYLFFLLSGILKTILNHYNINLPIDITLLLGVFLVFDIILSIAKANNSYYINKTLFLSLVVLLSFFIWSVFSLSYTLSENYGNYKSIAFLTNVIAFSYPILSKKINTNKFIKRYIFYIIAISIWFIPLLRQNQLKYNLFFAENTGGLYLTLSQNFGIIFILVLFKNKLFKNNFYKKAILLFSIIALFSLGGRGPMVALIFTLFFYFINNGNIAKYLQIKFTKNKILILSISAIFISLILIYSISSNDYLISLLERAQNRFALLFAENKGGSVNTRVEHIHLSLKVIFDNIFNFLFGYGFGSYGFLSKGIDIREFPHNIFLETWVELGFIGLIIIVLFFLLLVFLINKYTYKKYLVLYFIIITMFSGSLVDIRIIFGILAVIANIDIEKKQPIAHE